jgi:pseudaminic acid biosynthesis-associated methylase
MSSEYKTEQEEFWAGTFGDSYINRNISEGYLASNIHLFSNIFKSCKKHTSLIEFGANVGMNLKAIKTLLPTCSLHGVEINERACEDLKNVIGAQNVYHDSIFDFNPTDQFDIVLIKGVLIHINPEKLDLVYDKLYHSSKKYMLICEYYNPSPVSIEYRGHSDRLFKRDFAGEIMDRFTDVQLVDYGFAYHRDISFPQDDCTWFLLEKNIG